MPVDYRSLYDRDFLGAWDLKDDRDTVVRITSVEGGNIVGLGGRKSKKPILHVHGTTKGLAINATNGKAIAAMYGPMIENWVNKRIALYKSTANNPNGEGMVDCIRVRPQIPQPKGSTAAPEEPSEPALSLSDATAMMHDFTDLDAMQEWADTLHADVRSDPLFGKAYKQASDRIRLGAES